MGPLGPHRPRRSLQGLWVPLSDVHGWPEPPAPPPEPRAALAAVVALAVAVLATVALVDLTADPGAKEVAGSGGDAATAAGGPSLVERPEGDIDLPQRPSDPADGADEGSANATEGGPANATDQEPAEPAPAPSATAAPLAPQDDRAIMVPGDGEHARHFAWAFQGETWTYDMAIPDTVYQDFRARDRPLRMLQGEDGMIRMHAYDLYVSEPSDDAFVDALAAGFVDTAAARGWDDATRAGFVLAFVQSLPYTSDNVTSPFDEYPRFPVETLVDEGGDCEDTTVLLGALLAAMGHEVVLLSPPGHMALGVVLEGVHAPFYEHQGKKYHYVETTGSGWRIGEVPEPYADVSVQVFGTAPTPLLEAHMEVGPAEDGRQRFTLRARNVGTAPAHDVVLSASLQDGDDLRYDRRACREDVLEVGRERVCDVWLDLRTVPEGVAVRLHIEAEDGTWLHDRLVSASWTPRPV